jgi:hypothetical protein
MNENSPPSSAPPLHYHVRMARPDDTISIIDLALRVRGFLHFPPAQIEWMLKQTESDFLTLLAYSDSGNRQIQGFLIGKKKANQFEVLELYSEKENARAIYLTLFETLEEAAKQKSWEGLSAFIPGNDSDLQEALLDAKFYRTKVIPSYYVSGESAELWACNIVAKDHATH